jgi:FkbM family methyltransferase
VGKRRARFEAREAFFAAAAEVTPYVAVEVGSEIFFVATDDLGVGRLVFVREKRKDMATLAKGLAELAARGIDPPPDPVFVEVGANIGTTTVMALRRHGFATAVALEPSPQNVWLCRLNLVANGLDDNVTLLPFAASNRAAELELVIGDSNSGGHRVLAAGSGHPAVAGSVQSVTLDSLVEDGTIDQASAGLLWCDAPGHDALAVLGAKRLVEARVPLIVNVSSAIDGQTRDAFVELLTAHYGEIVELRHAKRTLPIDELADLVAHYQRKGDVLFVPRRPWGDVLFVPRRP